MIGCAVALVLLIVWAVGPWHRRGAPRGSATARDARDVGTDDTSRAGWSSSTERGAAAAGAAAGAAFATLGTLEAGTPAGFATGGGIEGDGFATPSGVDDAAAGGGGDGVRETSRSSSSYSDSGGSGSSDSGSSDSGSSDSGGGSE
jgi:hypothetical protein